MLRFTPPCVASNTVKTTLVRYPACPCIRQVFVYHFSTTKLPDYPHSLRRIETTCDGLRRCYVVVELPCKQGIFIDSGKGLFSDFQAECCEFESRRPLFDSERLGLTAAAPRRLSFARVASFGTLAVAALDTLFASGCQPRPCRSAIRARIRTSGLVQRARIRASVRQAGHHPAVAARGSDGCSSPAPNAGRASTAPATSSRAGSE